MNDLLVAGLIATLLVFGLLCIYIDKLKTQLAQAQEAVDGWIAVSKQWKAACDAHEAQWVEYLRARRELEAAEAKIELLEKDKQIL